jgi:hypothetical protein
MLIALFVALAAVALASRGTWGWRASFVLALLAAAVLAVVFTVVPSLFVALRPGVVLAGWAAACFAPAWLAAGNPPRWPARPAVRGGDAALELGTVLLLLSLTLLVAAMSVPRVYDAVAYHVPRVFFWIQNQSAAFYPTPEPRQNYISPLSAYAAVQAMLLHDSDSAPLLVQWAAYLGVVVAATLVADELGAGPRARTLVGALVASVPNLALQAQTALTDVVTTFLVVVAAWTVLRARAMGETSRALGWSAVVGAAFGLAVLAKASSAFWLAPFGLWWVLRRGGDRRPRIGELFVAGSVFLLLNGYHFAQAQLAYGSPVSSAGHASYLNGSFGPRTMAASLLEHASAHLLLPVTTAPVRIELGDRWNRGVERAVRRAEVLLGVDPDADNLPEGTAFSLSLAGPTPPPVANSPQSSGSTLHFLLATSASLLAVGSRRTTPAARRCAGAIVAGFVVFGACFRWQPWIGRFHLPYLVLGTVLFALALEPMRRRRSEEWLRRGLVCAALAYTTTLVVLHQEHDLRTVWTTSKGDLQLQAPLVRPLAQRLAHFETIGVLARPNAVVYPFLRALEESAPDAEVFPVFAELPWRGGIRRSRDDARGVLLVTQYGEPPGDALARLRRERYRQVLANPMGRAWVARRDRREPVR